MGPPNDIPAQAVSPPTLTWKHLSEGEASMAEELSQMQDHFSMTHFLRALNDFAPPTEPFRPAAAWENRYEVYVSTGGVAPIGALVLRREPLTAGGARLHVTMRKRAAGGTLHARAHVDCDPGPLAPPLGWRLETVAHDDKGEPIERTRLSETATATATGFEIAFGDARTQVAVERPFALDWGLFDAVQSLPRKSAPPHEFTLIDRLNHETKPGQRLSFRGTALIALGGRTVWREEPHELERGTVYRPVASREGVVNTRLHAFEHFGRGILPTVYWVDDSGRLLMVLSGLIAYIYSPEAQA